MQRIYKSKVIRRAVQKRAAPEPAPTPVAERQKKRREERPVPVVKVEPDEDGIPLTERMAKKAAGVPAPPGGPAIRSERERPGAFA